MSTTTKSGAEKNVATSTPSIRSKALREQYRALQENKWWPFNRADARVLNWMHRQSKSNPTTDLPEALF
jgi:hypothetical protein